MLEVLTITGVVFLVIAAGWLAVRVGPFAGSDMAVLGKYVVNFALPALIFHAVSTRDLAEILNPGAIGGYLIGSLLMFVGGYNFSRRLAGRSRGAGAFDGMGMACANSGFIGYPIMLMAMPPIAATGVALVMVVENVVMIPLVLIMAERGANGDGLGGAALARKIAGRLIRTPLVIALFAGLAVSLSGLPLPRVISQPIDLFAASSAAVSLLVIGGTLAGLPLRAVDVRLVPVVLGKLILHPLAVWLGLTVMAAAGLAVTDERLVAAMILFAAMPAMAIYPILAQRYGEQASAALAMLVMTVLSFFTVSTILWLLGVVPAS